MATVKPAKVKLTESLIRAIAPPVTGQAFTWDTQERGLGVRCTANGSKAYIAQGQCQGKTIRVTLGPVGTLTLDQARQRAKAAALLMLDGIHPTERKKAQRIADITLREVMDDYLENRRTKFGKLRPRSAEEIRKQITHNLGDWLDRPIGNIKHSMVATRFRAISERAPVQANLTMITLQSLCSWARDKSLNSDGVPTLLPFNPVEMAFRQLVKKNHVAPRTKRVPTDKTGAVWSLLYDRATNTAAYTPSMNHNAALTLALLLVGSRFNELATLQWQQVFLDGDGNDPMPHIEFDTKTHRILKIPCSKQLAALLRLQLERRPPNQSYVFLGKTGLNHIKDNRDTLKKVSELVGLHITPHDLRRSFVQAGQTVGLQKHEIDLLSGHVPQDVTGVHYLESNDLRYLAAQTQKVADWMERAGAIYDAQQSGANVIELTTPQAA
jgi:integrase